MATHLIEIAELPEGWLKDLTIIGITRTITDESQGLVITGLRELKNQDAPLVLNSPHAGFGVQCMLDFAELERLVMKYVDGEEREQRTLPFRTAAHTAN